MDLQHSSQQPVSVIYHRSVSVIYHQQAIKAAVPLARQRKRKFTRYIMKAWLPRLPNKMGVLFGQLISRLKLATSPSEREGEHKMIIIVASV